MKIASGISSPSAGKQRLVLTFTVEVAGKIEAQFGTTSLRLVSLTEKYAEFEPTRRGAPDSARISQPDEAGYCRMTFRLDEPAGDFRTDRYAPGHATVSCGKLVVELPPLKNRRPATVRPKNKQPTTTKKGTVLFLAEPANEYDVPHDTAALILKMIEPHRRGA